MAVRRLLALLCLVVTGAPGAGAQLLGRGEFLFTGILDRFPDPDGRLAVRGRDGELYTVLAGGARVEVGYRGPGTLAELRPGVILDVHGQRRGPREVAASRLHVVGGETGAPPREIGRASCRER